MTERIPFFRLVRLYEEQKAEIDGAILEVLAGGHYVLGKHSERFELAFEQLIAPSATERGRLVGCNSGTDALVLSMLAAGVGAGDEVVVPSHTAIPTVTAIRAVGATPVFADVDPSTWVLDAAAAEAALSARTKAVICVHLYGNVVDVDDVQNMLTRKGSSATIIEDVAQASGSSLRGRQAGSLARFGAFSFYPTKNLGALGDAGAVFAGDATDAANLRMLRNYGQRERYSAELPRGINSRLDEVQAAILFVRMRRLTEWRARKSAMVERYRDELAGCRLSFQQVTDGASPDWHLCVVAMESRADREALINHLRERNVDTLIHYPHPTHLQQALQSGSPVKLPVTESLTDRILSLPMNAGLRSDEQTSVIAAVREFFA